jgi:malate permease and related proteins
VDRPLAILGGAVLPLVLIYAGLVIEWDGVRRAWREVALATVLRFTIGPAVVLGVALLLGFGDDINRTVVLMAAMPTAMMSLVIGGWFRLNTDVIAGAVVVTTLLATGVLPVLRALL